MHSSNGLKILGGELRSRRIGPIPREMSARPILVTIKKSLFDILKNRIVNSSFLDLFAGSGAVGLEALSRGAGRVVFVDSSPLSQKWIEKILTDIRANPSFLSLSDRAAVCRADVLSGLAWLNAEFDLIFSGAPYVDSKKQPRFFVEILLQMIRREKILRESGWFIAQHHNKEKFKVAEGWNFFRQERYGDSVLSFFRPC